MSDILSTRSRLVLYLALFALSIGCFALASLIVASPVFAADVIPGPGTPAPAPGDQVVITGLPLAQALAAFIVNAVGYVLNYLGPQVSEQAKGTVILVLNLLAGVVIQAVDSGNFGWNTQTAVMVFSAFVSALIAHKVLSVTGLAFALGAGRNRQTYAPTNTQKALVGKV